MPWEWTEPEQLLKYHGVRIFHTYKDEFSDVPLEFWYSTSSTAAPGTSYEFDVRDLPSYRWRGSVDEVSEHKRVIKAAIDGGLLLSETPVTLDSHA